MTLSKKIKKLQGCTQAFNVVLHQHIWENVCKADLMLFDSGVDSGNEKCKVAFRPDASCNPGRSCHGQLVHEKLWWGFYFDVVCCSPASAVKLKARQHAVKFNQEPTQEVHLPEQTVIYCNWRRQQSPAGLVRSRMFIRDSQYREESLLYTYSMYRYWLDLHWLPEYWIKLGINVVGGLIITLLLHI